MSRSRPTDLAAVLGLLVLAAVLRLPNLATRGTWDGDQGHDMLMLRGLVRDGVVPLLGPPTSIGDFHHGALYYYLLAPAAALTGGESPLAVVILIALTGIGAVGVTWWLARSIAGPIAGLVAGLLMAVSIAAIDESTFIWNPNPIPLFAALALAGAWRAWTSGGASWWLLAAVATAVTVQLHVLSLVFLPIVVALFLADLRRRRRGQRGGLNGTTVATRSPRSLTPIALAALAILALSYVPLVVNELTTDFSETRAALDYLAGGREGSDVNVVVRLLIVGLRVVTWPLVGLIVDAGAAALLAAAAFAALTAWVARGPTGAERTAVRWLGLGLVWSTVALALAATSLASVVRGLPNDHYHAFADPIVFTLTGVGVAAAWRWRGPGNTPRLTGPAVAIVVVAALVGWNLTRLPPGTAPDGGYPAAQDAAQRIGQVIGDRPTTLRSIPPFKSTEAYAYPLVLEGRRLVPDADAEALVVICDSLFEQVVGAKCGGPAEDAVLGPQNRFAALTDRWQAAPGRTISVYLTLDE